MCKRELAGCVLIVINVLFIVVGGVCLGIGLMIALENSFVMRLTRISEDEANTKTLKVVSLIETAAVVLSIGGGFVFCLAFFGCCAALKKNPICLYLYITLVAAILLVQLSAVVLAIVYNVQFKDWAQKYMNATLINKYVGPYDRSKQISLAWDVAQVAFTCCGALGQDNYQMFSTWNKTWVNPKTKEVGIAAIPLTCCELKVKSTDFKLEDIGALDEMIAELVDPACPVTKAKSHKNCCFDELQRLFLKYAKLLIAVGVFIAMVEILAIVAAFCTVPSGILV